MLTCSENPTLRYSLCLCDQEKDFRKNRSDVVMKKMVELLGEERGPQDIEEVCFGEIKISKFVQSLIPEFIYISPSGKSCTRCGALHFCDENLTNCVNNKTFLHIFSFDGLWFFITPRPPKLKRLAFPSWMEIAKEYLWNQDNFAEPIQEMYAFLWLLLYFWRCL